MEKKSTSGRGLKPLGFKEYFIYGLGNFGSQLSWTMVSTYLSVFYTNVFGLTPGIVAVLMLVAKVWDGINDPMMGTLMERTHTKWGRFRPYIFIGAPLLVLFTILTFTVPGFGGPAKLAYAYVTYIGLGMSYTVTNVPYLALPAAMTDNPKEVNRLMSAQMMGMSIGQIVLNLSVLPLIKLIGKGNEAAGYQSTAIILAFLSLPIFWAVSVFCKERITVKKEKQGTVREGLKLVFRNRNLVCAIAYAFFNMMGMLGRIAIALYFYLYCVQNSAFITVFMMMQMIIGTLIMPIAPKVIEKIGNRNTAIISMLIQGTSLVVLFVGPYENVIFTFIMLVIYGLGYIAGPCGSCMMIDAIDDFEYKHGIRNDGMAFSFQGLGVKIGSAIGNSVCLLIIGAFGYYGGAEITERVKFGINFSTNIVPAIVYFLGIIPLLLYKLDKPGYMKDIRAKLEERRKADAEQSNK